MNKTLAAALAIVTASTLGLSGCGSAGGDVKKTADGKVQITMWHGFSEADGKTLEGIVDSFNKSQDKYQIDAQLHRGPQSARPWSPRSLPVMAPIS